MQGLDAGDDLGVLERDARSVPLYDFDHVIVDDRTPHEIIERLRNRNIDLTVATVDRG